MMERNEKVSLGVFVASIILIGMVFISNSTITGRAVSSQDELEEANIDNGCLDSDGTDYSLKGSTNSCINGGCVKKEDSCSGKKVIEWYCSGDKALSKEHECEDLCDSGVCIEKVEKFSYRGGYGTSTSSSSADSAGSQTIASTESQNIHDLGEINAEKIAESGENDKITLSISGDEYDITTSNISPTQATLKIGSLGTIDFSVGESKEIDLDSDGSNDITIWLKSVNTRSHKVKLILR